MPSLPWTCHTVNSNARKIPYLSLTLGIVFFRSLSKIHDHRWGLEQRLIYMTDSFAVFESSCFVTTERWSSRKIDFALSIRVSFFVPSSVAREYHHSADIHSRLVARRKLRAHRWAQLITCGRNCKSLKHYFKPIYPHQISSIKFQFGLFVSLTVHNWFPTIFLKNFSKIINAVGWPDDLHGSLPILCDKVTFFA